MKALIIEDEVRAADRLEQLLKEVDPNISIIGRAESIKDAVAILTASHPELIFSDIQLEDGLSFEIFEQVEIRCPIIFTTAYDQYAIEAFKTNGIDYLLKPVDASRLKQSLNKVKKLSPNLSLNSILALANSPTLQKQKYKTRFVIKVGERIKSIGVDEIQAFFSHDNATYLLTNEGRRYPIDYSLDLIDGMLNPEMYFRISRKFIISIHACQDIIAWSNSRLKIQLKGIDDQMVVVSRERVQVFKAWLDSE